eukprot:597652-Rhodomonas_salina.2
MTKCTRSGTTVTSHQYDEVRVGQVQRIQLGGPSRLRYNHDPPTSVPGHGWEKRVGPLSTNLYQTLPPSMHQPPRSGFPVRHLSTSTKARTVHHLPGPNCTGISGFRV